MEKRSESGVERKVINSFLRFLMEGSTTISSYSLHSGVEESELEKARDYLLTKRIIREQAHREGIHPHMIGYELA